MKHLTGFLITISVFVLFAPAAQAADPKPAPTPTQAPSTPIDRAERIRAYFAAFGTSADPTVRLDIARLRLIYDPTTRDFFTPAQRQVAELMILRRDTETGKLLPISRLPAWAAEHYGVTIGKPSFFGHWNNFLERIGDIPAIRAEQDTMRRIILADTSLTETERAFALAALTTLKDGVPPAIEKTAAAFNIARRRSTLYNIIERQRLAYDAAARASLITITPSHATISPGIPGPVMIHHNFVPVFVPALTAPPIAPVGISGR